MLEEAAAELFLEQGYAGTTVEQVARRAGVSRNTFFNYFPVKSDLLWVDVDAGLAELPRALKRCPAHLSATDAVRQALHEVAAGFGPGRVPWALTQAEVMGTRAALEASALSRLMTQSELVSRFVAGRVGAGGGDAGRRRRGRRPGRRRRGRNRARLPQFRDGRARGAMAAAGVWAASGVSRASCPLRRRRHRTRLRRIPRRARRRVELAERLRSGHHR